MAIKTTLRNEAFLNEVQSGSPQLVKQAQERMTSMVRLMVREGAVDRQVLVPEYITYSDLDRQVDTDVMVKIVDVEPNSPAAFSVGFGSASPMFWIAARRVRATFNRIKTNEALYDVELLGTWEMDIQEVIANNMIRDILAREDGGFFNAVNDFVGAADAINSVTQSVTYATIYGGYTRETLQEAAAVMLKSAYRLQPVTVVINTVTARRLMSLGREELGDDSAGRIFREGFSQWKFDNLNWVVTSKRHIVADDEMYFFADPRAVGKFYILNDTTTHLTVDGHDLRFYSSQTYSQVVVNVAGLAKVRFA